MKHFLVIGGSSGIGREVTQKLLAEGYRVTATFRNSSPNFFSNELKWFKWDVEEDFPSNKLPDRLDGFVYCPGAIHLKPFIRAELTDFEKDFKIQVLGAVKSLQASLHSLKKSGRASIVLFSTVAVQTGLPFHSIVSASKGAIEGLARALAAELAPGIRVNVIAPSLTDTPLAAKLLNNEEKRLAAADRHPLRRVGIPEEQANAAVFLLTEKSSWITGHVLKVDGGLSTIKI